MRKKRINMCQFGLSKEKTNLINEYLKKILEINKSINLTRITDIHQAKILHIEDSLSVLPEINESIEGLYGDLGTGGGFPGVPIAIATNRNTVLVDSVSKKISAIRTVINDLDINNIETYDNRIEELALDKPSEFSCLTARALSQLPSLIELAAPLLKMNGSLICLKAKYDKDELEHSLKIQKKIGMKFIKERNFYLSDGETYRSVLVFQKISEPKIKLPRKIGIAQRKPL